MGKFILLLSLLGTAILFSLGLTDPNNSIMWLASTSLNFAYLRIAMMVVLASLLATHPPRKIFLRYLVGIFALSLTSWAFTKFYSNSMNVLDFLSIMQFGVSTGLIVLESKRLPLETDADRIILARNTRLYLHPVHIKSRG